eukprot:superscaffoldBa00000526_g5407
MMASPFGAVPVVVAVAVVGGSGLIIPQNPSQMSPSLGGRWAGAPLCRTATGLAALQTCWYKHICLSRISGSSELCNGKRSPPAPR